MPPETFGLYLRWWNIKKLSESIFSGLGLRALHLPLILLHSSCTSFLLPLALSSWLPPGPTYASIHIDQY